MEPWLPRPDLHFVVTVLPGIPAHRQSRLNVQLVLSLPPSQLSAPLVMREPTLMKELGPVVTALRDIAAQRGYRNLVMKGVGPLPIPQNVLYVHQVTIALPQVKPSAPLVLTPQKELLLAPCATTESKSNNSDSSSQPSYFNVLTAPPL